MPPNYVMPEQLLKSEPTSSFNLNQPVKAIEQLTDLVSKGQKLMETVQSLRGIKKSETDVATKIETGVDKGVANATQQARQIESNAGVVTNKEMKINFKVERAIEKIKEFLKNQEQEKTIKKVQEEVKELDVNGLLEPAVQQFLEENTEIIEDVKP